MACKQISSDSNSSKLILFQFHGKPGILAELAVIVFEQLGPESQIGHVHTTYYQTPMSNPSSCIEIEQANLLYIFHAITMHVNHFWSQREYLSFQGALVTNEMFNANIS